MLLGRVIGTVVPATQVDGLSATPFLWIQPLDRGGRPEGEPLVCADPTRMAGPGQIIYWVASREAALACDPWFVPVDDAIVGLVDEVRNYAPEELAGEELET
jgi:ethanolamine utilization protein EutN